ncbi:competence type IV pilus ATPase ComGA [Bacillus daqingensis]|uniref:Competence type IV pilus ATPase ComGA n=1 Tax=Bacillus daqingensis TaxID=872396 RepID=A0ABV9NXL8_9BACI
MEAPAALKQLLADAVKLKASDIHLIPAENGLRIRYRVDGVLLDIRQIPFSSGRKLVSHMKFIAGMDIGERRRPQNKRMEVTLQGQTIFVRLSTFPSALLETLVLRIYPVESSAGLLNLTLFPSQAASLQKLIHCPHGLILICGPTGSGKTTTLYSLLKDRMTYATENIMTLEDPVERKESGLLQMEINEKAGVTYAAGLRSLLRHDPDLIVIGEIRDEETAAVAVKAAMSGHLVLSSLHCSSASAAVRRMLDLGVDRADLQEVLHGTVSQRLADLACPYCNSSCSIYCRSRREVRRKAIFEILMEQELQDAFHQLETGVPASVPRIDMQRLLIKGTALGYIPFSAWKQKRKGSVR